jgi:hypothetical protein
MPDVGGLQAFPAVAGTDRLDPPSAYLTGHAAPVKDGVLSSQTIA